MNLAQKILVFLLRAYQRVVSPALVALSGPMGRCRFEPSCSQYAVEAVRAHGAIRGAGLALWRIFRCNPWGGSGPDPVPEKLSPKDSHSITHPHTAGFCGHRHN